MGRVAVEVEEESDEGVVVAVVVVEGVREPLPWPS